MQLKCLEDIPNPNPFHLWKLCKSSCGFWNCSLHVLRKNKQNHNAPFLVSVSVSFALFSLPRASSDFQTLKCLIGCRNGHLHPPDARYTVCMNSASKTLSNSTFSLLSHWQLHTQMRFRISESSLFPLQQSPPRVFFGWFHPSLLPSTTLWTFLHTLHISMLLSSLALSLIQILPLSPTGQNLSVPPCFSFLLPLS